MRHSRRGQSRVAPAGRRAAESSTGKPRVPSRRVFPSGKEWSAAPSGALLFLASVRTEFDPQGAQFLDLVRLLSADRSTAQVDRFRIRLLDLMAATGASSKFVLRKLASAVLPGRGKAKQVFLRETLRLGHLPCTEKVRARGGLVSCPAVSP